MVINFLLYALPLEYTFVREFGKKGKGDGEFNYPVCITLDRYGNIYVSDWDNHRIQKFNRKGEFLKSIAPTKEDREKYKLKKLLRPIGVVTTINDLLYVSDYNNHCFMIFTLSGDLIKVVGGFGKGKYKFRYPRGITADDDGNIYIADFNNYSIKKYDKNGEFLDSFRTIVKSRYYQPRSLAINSKGEIWIVFSEANFIGLFSKNGKFIKKIGRAGEIGGEFRNPRYIALDIKDNIYVTDYKNNRVQIFSSKGEYFGDFGDKGKNKGEFNSPEGIVIDVNGNVLVVDARNNRVQEFGTPPETSYRYLAIRYKMINFYDEAFKNAEKLLEIKPEDKEGLKILKESGLALLEKMMLDNNQNESIKILKTLLTYFPEDEQILNIKKKLIQEDNDMNIVNNGKNVSEISSESKKIGIKAAIFIILSVVILLIFLIFKKNNRNRMKSKKKVKKRKKQFKNEELQNEESSLDENNLKNKNTKVEDDNISKS